MSKITELELFVRVVDEGSFSAVSRIYGVTPSAISKQISQMEEQLNARLFNRTTRKQSLTEAGTVYYQHAKKIIDDVAKARLAVSNLVDSPSGVLHISAEVDFALTFIEPLTQAFLLQYPNIQLRLRMNTSLDDIVKGGIDVALRIGKLYDSSLIARPIMKSRSVICASPQYLHQHGELAHPLNLSNHNCMSFRIESGQNSWRFKIAEDEHDIPVHGSLSVNSISYLKRAAITGLGVIMIPKWKVRDELASGQLVSVLEDFPMVPEESAVQAVYANKRQLAPKIRAFIDFLTDNIRKDGR